MSLWDELAKPFEPQDIEWRVQQSGTKDDGKPWAKVVAYVTSRAIQERLDQACGPANWQTDLRPDAGGVICGLGIRNPDNQAEWIWKWDGAPYSDIEGYKGGISGAIKRAAVLHGLGRYLYGLPLGWAVFVAAHQGAYRSEIKGKNNQKQWCDWNPPELPKWALPGGYVTTTPASTGATKSTTKPVPDVAHTQKNAKGTAVPRSENNYDFLAKKLETCKAPNDVHAFGLDYKKSINDLPDDLKDKLVARAQELQQSLKENAA